MTKLNKWVVIETGYDEDEHDIDVDIFGVFDNKEDAKKELKNNIEAWYGSGECKYNISWDNDETKFTITSDDDCEGWCKVYKIEKI